MYYVGLYFFIIFQLFQFEFCHWMKQAAVEFFRLEFCSKKYIRFPWPVQLRSQKGLIDAYCILGLFDDLFKELK